MALEPIELVQLWVATIAGLAALIWEAYDRLNQPRLRVLEPWSRPSGDSNTEYGVVVEYTGRRRAERVTISCELPGWQVPGLFADSGFSSTEDVEGEALVYLFTVGEDELVGFEQDGARPTGDSTEPPSFSDVRSGHLRIHVRCSNVEGSDLRMKGAAFVKRARSLPS